MPELGIDVTFNRCHFGDTAILYLLLSRETCAKSRGNSIRDCDLRI